MTSDGWPPDPDDSRFDPDAWSPPGADDAFAERPDPPRHSHPSQGPPAMGGDDPLDTSDDPAEWFAQWRDALPDEDDEDDDDLPTTAPFPLPPDDRIWRHPSELKYLAEPLEPETPSPTTRSMSLVAAGAMALTAGLIGAGVTAVAYSAIGPRSTNTVTERVVDSPSARATLTSERFGAVDIPAIAAAATPAIVRVEVARGGLAVGSGSGVIFRDDGHLITNAHVVEGGDAFRVVRSDGTIVAGELVGADALTDIAVVRLDESLAPYPIVTMGTTDGLVPGAAAIAIGSPLRLQGGPTVTVGVISATHRQLQASGGDVLLDLVQTDAPISPGSSGGALLDDRGTVIGITTAVAVSEVGAEGLGFATPIEVAHAVANDLIEYGEARHGWLGVRGEDTYADSLPSAYERGVRITAVEPEGPAQQAGFEVGDIIVEVDGEPVASMVELIVTARLLEPGGNATFTIVRGERTLAVEVTPGRLS